MCGLTGYFNRSNVIQSADKLYTATSLIAHRGPDDEGYVLFNLDNKESLCLSGPDSYHPIKSRFPSITEGPFFPHHLAFGFRRLSIVDLTEKGHQPFWSNDKTLCLMFNGEVYNYVEIREELKKLGYSFISSCDTEVLLAGYQAWGMDILKRCNGPLAIALLDLNKQKLFLARDRIGKNPLYFAIHQQSLYWASEIKSILSITGRSAFKINEQTIYDYLNFGWRDLDNSTSWDGIYTLQAASWTSIDINKNPTYEQIHSNLTTYWEFPSNRLTSKDISFKAASQQFTSLFQDAVRIRGLADANVAYSLSGGLDSSSIVATAANVIEKPFRTYSIKFPNQAFDEEPYARKVHEMYPEKIDYQVYVPENKDFWERADELIWLLEEPFHHPDSEQFQAYLRNARSENYKVVIVGGGGDELLCGYRNYFFPSLIHLRNNKAFLSMASNLFLRQYIWPRYCIRERIKILYALIRHHDDYLQKYFSVSFFNHTGQEVALPYMKDQTIKNRIRDNRINCPKDFHPLTVGFMSNWLMNYWQRNVDRAHFGVSIESRRPFLDYRLIDLVFTLPPEYILKRGWTKYLLRKSLTHWLPREVAWRRKKQGMPFNTKVWFTYAKPIIESHLRSIKSNPYFDIDTFLRDYDELLDRNPNFLWRGVSFCLWWKRVIEQQSL
jgi:asparagine synthase (glutamine-hydrolysing)